MHVLAELAVYSRCKWRQVCRFTSASESPKMCGVVYILSPLSTVYLQFKQTQASYLCAFYYCSIYVLCIFMYFHCRSFIMWIQTSSSYFGSLNWPADKNRPLSPFVLHHPLSLSLSLRLSPPSPSHSTQRENQKRRKVIEALVLVPLDCMLWAQKSS